MAMIANKSIVDQFFRAVIRSNFFTRGIGESSKVERLVDFHKVMSNREMCNKLVAEDYPVSISNIQEHDKWVIVDGDLKSPFAEYMPGFLPKESETSKFQFCIPRVWKTDDKPVAIHMAGTGDHNYWRRRLFMAKSLADDYGIASLILESPFYGSRKPAGQKRSNLRYVTDIFVMGGGLILESLAILHWLERHEFGPFCLTGISMGGHMASLAASNWHKPIPVVPCLSWTSASAVFTRGVMSRAINWESVEKEFVSDPAYRGKLMKKLADYKLELRPDVIPAPNIRPSRIKSVSTKAFSKVMESLGLSRLISNPSLFPFKSSPSSSIDFNPGKTSSFSLARFSFLEKAQDQSGGRSSNFNSEFNVQGTSANSKSEITSTMLWNVLKDVTTTDRRDTVEFMRRVMDHFTHVGNYSVPVDPALIIVVVARDDAYVLREGMTPVNEIWGGCELRVLEEGHVMSCMMGRDHFRRAIYDALNLYRKKYYRDYKEPTLKK